jgi:flagellar basal-body rod protein FlgB
LLDIEEVFMDEFKILERFINFTNMRHGVLTSNIANADTPGYKARDMEFKQALNNEIELSTTDPRHINPAGGGVSAETETDTSNSWKDENNVEIDMETAKMMENAMSFQAGITVLNTKIKMFKDAIRS